ncbi:hypothetical protein ZHAS_00019027 [Anopheles sinensis]|uniref:Uncharacterized protein n=1 Tax=Anopheles sinensis TaxID=74873 RepID=A0A084WL89_ANOSI|nr:hypothetical protein ZHAS_00019027 [Anopheles sinensis]
MHNHFPPTPSPPSLRVSAPSSTLSRQLESTRSPPIIFILVLAAAASSSSSSSLVRH